MLCQRLARGGFGQALDQEGKRCTGDITKQIWTYPDSATWGDADITCYDVEAADGSIGKIDESSAAAGSAYIVVDTGFWIFGKKRLVPAGVVDRVDRQNNKVYVRMTKDQVRNAPDFDETHRERRGQDDDTYYGTYVS